MCDGSLITLYGKCPLILITVSPHIRPHIGSGLYVKRGVRKPINHRLTDNKESSVPTVSHQCYNEMTSNELMLFKDLLYTAKDPPYYAYSPKVVTVD